MGKYLKKFENHSQYGSYIARDYVKPNVSLCVQENHVHYNPIPDYSKEYLTFVALESGTFTFTPTGSNVISYSTNDGTNWTEGNSVDVNNGDKVMWKGAMTPAEYEGIGTFNSTANFDVQGNPMSLLYGENFKGQTSLTGKDYAFSFYSLFVGSTVVSAENLLLPATALTNSCYGSMFESCTSLTTAPELPAETLASDCYSGMFRGCTGLTTAPELSAETLAGNCYYQMFKGCTSLVTAPELPAETLAGYCYSEMFRDCTSLTTVPELPATTLANGCYNNMFNGCANLNYIKAMFTTTPSSTYTYRWVYGVAASGTFVKNSAAQWNVSGVDGIPTGWTVETASA